MIRKFHYLHHVPQGTVECISVLFKLLLVHTSFLQFSVKLMQTRVSDPEFFQIPDPGVCTSNGEIFLNVYKMNVLDTIKRHLFCIYTFVVRRPLKALEPRIRIWSEFFP